MIFSEIYNKINPSCNIRGYNLKKDNFIKSIEFITEGSDFNNNSCLFIGKASKIESQKITQASLVIINDNNLKLQYLSSVDYIELTNEDDIYKVFNMVVELLLKEKNTINPASQFLSTLAEGKGMEEILETGARLLGNPLVVIDASYSVIAHTNEHYITDEIWKRNISLGYCSYEFIAAVKRLKSVKEAENNNEPFIVVCDESPVRKLVSKIIIDAQPVGFLILLECEGRITDDTLIIFKTLNYAVKEELNKDSYNKNLKGVKYENFLLDLIQGKMESEELAMERAKSNQLNFSDNLYVITLDILYYNMDKRAGKSLSESIEYVLPNSKALYYKDHIMVLLDLRNVTEGEEVFKKLEEFLRKVSIKAAVSSRIYNLTDVKKGFLQAKKTLELADRIKAFGSLFYYEDYKFYDLLSKVNGNLMEFCNASVVMLYDYDKTNNTTYFQTLCAYIENNENINKTAEALFLHRNTLSYRIDKIETITGLNLKDSQQIFNISYSCRILKYIMTAI